MTQLVLATIASGTMCLAASQVVFAQDRPIEELATHLPGSINSVMSVNVERIRDSALAKREGWGDTHAGNVASGLIFIPQGAKEVLMGSVMDYDAFHPRETAVLVTMDSVPSLDAIRQVTDGTVDELLGYQIVETTSDRYIVRLSDTMVAGLRPALRPFLGKWLGALKDDEKITVPDYLETGLGYADQYGTEIIVCFDMENTISRSRVMDRIADNTAIRENSLDPKVVSGLIASTDGCTLGITITDHMHGAVLIDFEEDIRSLHPIASDVARGVLNRTGLHLDEFDSWSVETSPRQIKLSGSLSVQSLRKLLSLVDAPQTHSAVAASSSSSSDSTADPDADSPAQVTKRYFDTVNSLVSELKPHISAGAAYTRNAHWLNQYADKIGAIGTLNVDPKMVDYGDYVSSQLRDAQMGLVETNETSQERNRDLIAMGAKSGGAGGRGGWGHSYDRYGWYGGGSGYRRRRTGSDGSRLRQTVRENQKSDAVESTAQIFSEIASAEVQIRQEMTAKYQIQF